MFSRSIGFYILFTCFTALTAVTVSPDSTTYTDVVSLTTDVISTSIEGSFRLESSTHSNSFHPTSLDSFDSLQTSDIFLSNSLSVTPLLDISPSTSESVLDINSVNTLEIVSSNMQIILSSSVSNTNVLQSEIQPIVYSSYFKSEDFIFSTYSLQNENVHTVPVSEILQSHMASAPFYEGSQDSQSPLGSINFNDETPKLTSNYGQQITSVLESQTFEEESMGSLSSNILSGIILPSIESTVSAPITESTIPLTSPQSLLPQPAVLTSLTDFQFERLDSSSTVVPDPTTNSKTNLGDLEIISTTATSFYFVNLSPSSSIPYTSTGESFAIARVTSEDLPFTSFMEIDSDILMFTGSPKETLQVKYTSYPFVESESVVKSLSDSVSNQIAEATFMTSSVISESPGHGVDLQGSTDIVTLNFVVGTSLETSLESEPVPVESTLPGIADSSPVSKVVETSLPSMTINSESVLSTSVNNVIYPSSSLNVSDDLHKFSMDISLGTSDLTLYSDSVIIAASTTNAIYSDVSIQTSQTLLISGIESSVFTFSQVMLHSQLTNNIVIDSLVSSQSDPIELITSSQSDPIKLLTSSSNDYIDLTTYYSELVILNQSDSLTNNLIDLLTPSQIEVTMYTPTLGGILTSDLLTNTNSFVITTTGIGDNIVPTSFDLDLIASTSGENLLTEITVLLTQNALSSAISTNQAAEPSLSISSNGLFSSFSEYYASLEVVASSKSPSLSSIVLESTSNYEASSSLGLLSISEYVASVESSLTLASTSSYNANSFSEMLSVSEYVLPIAPSLTLDTASSLDASSFSDLLSISKYVSSSLELPLTIGSTSNFEASTELLSDSKYISSFKLPLTIDTASSFEANTELLSDTKYKSSFNIPLTLDIATSLESSTELLSVSKYISSYELSLTLGTASGLEASTELLPISKYISSFELPLTLSEQSLAIEATYTLTDMTITSHQEETLLTLFAGSGHVSDLLKASETSYFISETNSPNYMFFETSSLSPSLGSSLDISLVTNTLVPILSSTLLESNETDFMVYGPTTSDFTMSASLTIESYSFNFTEFEIMNTLSLSSESILVNFTDIVPSTEFLEILGPSFSSEFPASVMTATPYLDTALESSSIFSNESSSFVLIEATSVLEDMSSTYNFSVTTEGLNTSFVLFDYWIRTVIEVKQTVNITDEFVYDMELKLVNIYQDAYQRQEDMDNGVYDPLLRKKRMAVSDSEQFKLQIINNVSRANDSNNVEMIYILQDNGSFVPAIIAVDRMNLFSDQEVALRLGYVVVVKAETFFPQPIPVEDKKLWIIGAVLGPIGLLLFIWLILCCVFRCCRKPPLDENKEQNFTEPHLVMVKRADGQPDREDMPIVKESYVEESLQRSSGPMLLANPKRGVYEVNPDPDEEFAKPASKRKSPTKKGLIPKTDMSDGGDTVTYVSEGDLHSNLGPKPKLRKSKSRSKETARLPDNLDDSMEDVMPLRTSPDPQAEELFQIERRRNKQRLRDKRKTDGKHSDSSRMSDAETLKDIPEVFIHKSKKKPSKPKRSKLVPQTNEGFSDDENEEKPPETLHEARKRMHQLLDDAFSLLSSSTSSIGNKVEPDSGDDKISSKPPKRPRSKKPNKNRGENKELVDEDKEKLVEEKIHTPVYVNPTYHKDTSPYGIETWTPYRAGDVVHKIGDEIMRISVPHEDPIKQKMPKQDKLHTTTFRNDDLQSSLTDNYYTHEPAKPIVIKTKDLDDKKPNDKKQNGIAQKSMDIPNGYHYPGLQNFEDIPIIEVTKYGNVMGFVDDNIELKNLIPKTQEHRNGNIPNGYVGKFKHTPHQAWKGEDELDVIKNSLTAGQAPTPLIDSIRDELNHLSKNNDHKKQYNISASNNDIHV